MPSPLAFLRKLRRHWQLLREDPEKFGFNLLQFTHPQRFQERLFDMQSAPPLQLRLEPALRATPALNVLQPVLSPAVMTGGPNTVVNLALWLAQLGLPVRIVTTRPTPAADLAWFWQHLCTLTGVAARPAALTVACAGDAACPLAIGPCDMFLATHWTTAQQLKPVLPQMEVPRFFYLLQDFEPGFYAWSSNYALAMETYGLDHIGVFNQRLLFDHFVAQGAGRYADPAFAAQSLVFEPAVDRAHFYPAAPATTATSKRTRRLLFYARASNPRNLLGLGLAALRKAISDPAFEQEPWEFWAIGGSNALPPISLGAGRTLQPAPWADYAGYGRLLRESDILLCPMLSPHTSYPVLEMAACGGMVVTNCFGSKTAQRLQAISPHILAAEATQEGLAQALVLAAQQPASRAPPGPDAAVPMALPGNWKAALQDTVSSIEQLFTHNTGIAAGA